MRKIAGVYGAPRPHGSGTGFRCARSSRTRATATTSAPSCFSITPVQPGSSLLRSGAASACIAFSAVDATHGLASDSATVHFATGKSADKRCYW